MKTFWCLYREAPFRVYFEGEGFCEPLLDETRKVKSYPSEEAARTMQKLLRERTFIGKRSYIRQRIKSHAYSVS